MMAKRIKSFENLHEHIIDNQNHEKFKDNHERFQYYQSLDNNEKTKYLQNCGISFKKTKGLYISSKGIIVMPYKNPFTGKRIVFDAKGLYSSDCMVNGHIKIKYASDNPEKIFVFKRDFEKSHFGSNNSTIPTQTRSQYEREKQKRIAESKARSDAKKEADKQKDQELLLQMKKLKAHERIYFDDFVTVHNVNYCISQNHNVEKIKALIFILRRDGTIMPKYVSAGYCHQCKRHFIEKWQFESLSDYGVPLCQVVREHVDYNYSIENNYYDELEPESILHRSGYNVSAENDLSTAQRQRILSLLLDSGLCSKYKITSHLTWLIDSRCGNPHMENAVSKWVEDRKFASNYKLEDDRVVGVRLVRNINRINKCD